VSLWRNNTAKNLLQQLSISLFIFSYSLSLFEKKNCSILYLFFCAKLCLAKMRDVLSLCACASNKDLEESITSSALEILNHFSQSVRSDGSF